MGTLDGARESLNSDHLKRQTGVRNSAHHSYCEKGMNFDLDLRHIGRLVMGTLVGARESPNSDHLRDRQAFKTPLTNLIMKKN